MADNDSGGLRDVLSAKYDEMAAAPEPVTPAVVEAAPVVEVAPVETPTPETRTASERARDEEGKFTKAPKPKATKDPSTVAPPTAKEAPPAPPIEGQGAAEAPPTTSAAPASPEAPKFKAPQSWKPDVREKWAALPVEVQAEVDRVDREIRRTMQESAEARKLASTVHQTLAPFEGLARANGMDAVKYAGNVMQTAAALQMGTPQQKAAIVAQLIGTYGIDVDAVNAVMQGQPAPQAAPQTDPRVDVRQEMARYISEIQNQQLTSQATQAIEKARGDAEFWNDIGEGKIVSMAAALINSEPGLDPVVALKNSYEMLSQRTPSVAATLKQRQEAEAAKARIASTQAAKTAAGSIRSTPHASGEARPVGLRAVLEHAADKMGMR